MTVTSAMPSHSLLFPPLYSGWCPLELVREARGKTWSWVSPGWSARQVIAYGVGCTLLSLGSQQRRQCTLPDLSLTMMITLSLAREMHAIGLSRAILASGLYVPLSRTLSVPSRGAAREVPYLERAVSQIRCIEHPILAHLTNWMDQALDWRV